MKKNLFAAVAALLLLSFLSCGTTGRGSRNSSDWAGVYTGVIPSASGMGINVRVTLNANETYTEEYQYIDRSDEIFTRSGKFKWNKEGDIIILDIEREGDFPSFYKIGENVLVHLDLEGNVITGELASHYILRKQQ